jgi:glycosyltransferase involved in cell wall biosynthesis
MELVICSLLHNPKYFRKAKDKNLMNKLRIGVVIPVGENIGHLQQCLESIVNQRQQPDMVILVLDYIILPSQLLDYVKTIPNVKIYNNCGSKGQAGARNYGYEMGADCDVIVNHDSDDLMLDDRIKIIFDFFTENPLVDIVFTDGFYMNSEGIVLKQINRDLGEQKNMEIMKKLARKNEFVHPTSAIRFETFKLVGGYDTSFPKMIDYNLYLKIALRNRIFAYLPIPTIHYRIHPLQISHNIRVGKHLFKMLKLRAELAYKIGYNLLTIVYLQFYWFIGKLLTELGIRKSSLRKLSDSFSKF